MKCGVKKGYKVLGKEYVGVVVPTVLYAAETEGRGREKKHKGLMFLRRNVSEGCSE